MQGLSEQHEARPRYASHELIQAFPRTSTTPRIPNLYRRDAPTMGQKRDMAGSHPEQPGHAGPWNADSSVAMGIPAPNGKFRAGWQASFHLRTGTRPARVPEHAGVAPRLPPRAVPRIVVYHHLSPTLNPLTDRLGVTTHPEIFRRHIRYFARNFDLISPSDLIAGDLPKRPLLVTFDDAYRSVLDVGGPILREFNAEALFFINPGNVLAETLPLDNVLCLASHQLGMARLGQLIGYTGHVAPSLPKLIMDHLSRLDVEHVNALKQLLCTSLGISQARVRENSGLFLVATDLAKLAGCGIHIGNHTMNHRFLRTLPPRELDLEIRGAQAALEQLSGYPVTCLSIPYGDPPDATAEALAVARMSGHHAIFLVQGQSNHRQPAPDMFYRISPGDAPIGQLIVSVGVLPHLRTIWRELRG
jgi:peptidoglycan/xylan/chitin deacetylase (PgdA/CDA1 family)